MKSSWTQQAPIHPPPFPLHQHHHDNVCIGLYVFVVVVVNWCGEGKWTQASQLDTITTTTTPREEEREWVREKGGKNRNLYNKYVNNFKCTNENQNWTIKIEMAAACQEAALLTALLLLSV